ncbi:hypothetical protein [Reichenbachiella agariperforans]|uniref:hypothetical protein n=1 Tax=Reichenbachiella agariperforans TaxID=156994 RepID=UPI001C0A1E94|nr:hypothetical protein [Reichenbachiella agariperforans]MBU2914424.1 hypothetical protein [Reichenbachiella agariperforans]
MLNKPFFFAFIFIGSTLFGLHIYDKNHKVDLTIEQAMEPVQHLSNARQAIVHEQFDRSIMELDEAIIDMRRIEKIADSSASAYVEKAIADLALVEAEIRNDTILLDDLNHAFFNALNSIAYANLTISEQNLDKGDKYKAIRFMNATFKEMVSSLEFATSERDKEKERKVIEDIKIILENMQKPGDQYNFNYDTLNREFEELIEIHD